MNIRDYKLGLKPSPDDERDYKIKDLIMCTPYLPKEYRCKLDPHIFDQGTSNECAGCAISNARSIQEFSQTNTVFVFSPSYIYTNRKDTDYQGEGLVLREALESLKDNGICYYVDFPGFYDTLEESKNKKNELNSHNLDVMAFPYRISSYYRLNSDEDIKLAIYKLGCVLAGWTVKECMYNVDNTGKVIYNSEDKEYGGHALLIIGYNEYGWIVANSWSSNYGDNGIMYIPYEYKPLEAWAMVDEILEKQIESQNN